ncbi:uncharacterized protein TNCT_406221, partial [Trichonephila clavata]
MIFSVAAVSDLSEAARILRKEKPFETKYEQTTQLFLPSTRPPCVDRLYGTACTTPVALMCTIDRYRTDGLSASQLFMVTPVLGGGAKRKKRKLLDIETRKPANFSLAARAKIAWSMARLPFPLWCRHLVVLTEAKREQHGTGASSFPRGAGHAPLLGVPFFHRARGYQRQGLRKDVATQEVPHS